MIVIQIILRPHGDENRDRQLGELHIFNDGTGTAQRGNYGVRVYGKDARQIRQGEVKNYARLSRPVFDLVAAALESAGYKALTTKVSPQPPQEGMSHVSARNDE